MSEGMTPRPTIDIESPYVNADKRYKEFVKLLPKSDKKEYDQTYRVMKRFRTRQRVLLDGAYYEDPYPFEPTYIFYCFQGTLEE